MCVRWLNRDKRNVCLSKFITPMKLKDFMDSQFWSFGMEPLKVLPDTCRVH